MSLGLMTEVALLHHFRIYLLHCYDGPIHHSPGQGFCELAGNLLLSVFSANSLEAVWEPLCPSVPQHSQVALNPFAELAGGKKGMRVNMTSISTCQTLSPACSCITLGCDLVISHKLNRAKPGLYLEGRPLGEAQMLQEVVLVVLVIAFSCLSQHGIQGCCASVFQIQHLIKALILPAH